MGLWGGWRAKLTMMASCELETCPLRTRLGSPNPAIYWPLSIVLVWFGLVWTSSVEVTGSINHRRLLVSRLFVSKSIQSHLSNGPNASTDTWPGWMVWGEREESWCYKDILELILPPHPFHGALSPKSRGAGLFPFLGSIARTLFSQPSHLNIGEKKTEL